MGVAVTYCWRAAGQGGKGSRSERLRRGPELGHGEASPSIPVESRRPWFPPLPGDAAGYAMNLHKTAGGVPVHAYFSSMGFERWHKIYGSPTDDVNRE